MPVFDDAARAADDLIKRLGKPSPAWPPTDLELEQMLAAAEARRPKQTMDRMADVISRRGLEHVGNIKDLEASAIGAASSAPGPGGLESGKWAKLLAGFPDSPDSTPVYVANPIEAVASQYPPELRAQAIDTARRFQMPMRSGGSILFQHALKDPAQKAVILAYPRRQTVDGAAGLAHFGARGDAPGLVEIAAGRNISPEFFDRVLLHELRHTLEGGGLGARYSVGGYQDWRAPQSVVSARKKEYLSGTGEEVARFGDGRARYAQRTGRLIADNEEAEHAADMILSNRLGLGEGFYAPERAFYRAAREADPNIRAHQNKLLQGLLSVPAAVAALPDDE